MGRGSRDSSAAASPPRRAAEDEDRPPQRRVSIDSLIVYDEDHRDPVDYGEPIASMPRAQAEPCMDAIDTFGPAYVQVHPRSDGTVILQKPTGKMRSTDYLVLIGLDGESIGAPEVIARAPR